MKTFAIIIPTKNRPEMLNRCLQSLYDQIPEHLMSTVVVVDDGSEYKASIQNKKICSTFTVSYIPYQVSKGPAATRNTGINNSKGEWIVFLDDDVIINCKWYDILCTTLNTCPQSCVGIEGKVNPSGSGIWDKEVQNLIGGAYLSCHIIYNRSILLMEEGFDSHFYGPFCEDHELAARMLQHGSIVFAQDLSVTHQPRNVNVMKYLLSTPSRIKMLLQSEFHFYTKHPDRYHQFRGHATFAGTLVSMSLLNVIQEIRRRSIQQYIRNPFQTLMLLTIAFTEQVFLLFKTVQYFPKILTVTASNFLSSVDRNKTIQLWALPHFNICNFTLKRSLLHLLLFRIIRMPVYNALPTHKRLSLNSKGSSSHIFLRVDDVFLTNTETIERFTEIIKKESVPILAGILGSEINDPTKWPLIELLYNSGAYIAIHGFYHQGSFGPFTSEFLQMNTITFMNNLDPVLDNINKLKQPCAILIPPFNAIGSTQIVEWSKSCKIICGGPETVRFTNKLYGPLALTSGGWYFPSISPFYSNAKAMISNRIPELINTFKGPLCLTTHFTHESNDNFDSFIYLIKSIGKQIHSWNETAQW